MEHEFSVEVGSKSHIKRMSFSTDSNDGVLLEGYLGELVGLSMIEGVILEVKGVNGVLRIDLSECDLRKMFTDLREGGA